MDIHGDPWRSMDIHLYPCNLTEIKNIHHHGKLRISYSCNDPMGSLGWSLGFPWIFLNAIWGPFGALECTSDAFSTRATQAKHPAAHHWLATGIQWLDLATLRGLLPNCVQLCSMGNLLPNVSKPIKAHLFWLGRWDTGWTYAMHRGANTDRHPTISKTMEIREIQYVNWFLLFLDFWT